MTGAPEPHDDPDTEQDSGDDDEMRKADTANGEGPPEDAKR